MKDNKKLYIGAYILNKIARTENHIRRVKEADIDFMVSVDYNDKETLDLFEKYSLGAIVNGVFPSWWGSDGEKSGLMSEYNPIEGYEECIKKYTPHKAIWGVDVGDEISCRDFRHIKRIYETYNTFFSDKLMYMNLYPNYGVRFDVSCDERKKQWGCSSYTEYIEKYCREVPLPYICFDHYPYCHNDMYAFVENLQTVSDMAEKYGKSVYLVAQSSSYSKDKFLTQTQLRAQLYAALTFNVNVIMWACYSAGWWHNHVIDENGCETPLYENIALVNREIKDFYKKIQDYKSGKVHILNSDKNIINFSNNCSVSLPDDAESLNNCMYIVCEMMDTKSGEKDAIYIANIGTSGGEFTLNCENTPELYCEDPKCQIKKQGQPNTYKFDPAPGYGAIVKLK